MEFAWKRIHNQILSFFLSYPFCIFLYYLYIRLAGISVVNEIGNSIFQLKAKWVLRVYDAHNSWVLQNEIKNGYGE